MKSSKTGWPDKMLWGALMGLVIFAGGCCGVGPRPLRPLFPPCDPAHCEEGCGDEGCGIAADRATEADLTCQGCLPGPAMPASCYPGPLSWLFARLTWPYGPGFAGCGERYWSPWASDPPDCCDPCDGYGQWSGRAFLSGYSGMYPNLFPGGVYSREVVEGQTEPASAPAPPPRAPCSECSRSSQARSGWVPPMGKSGWAMPAGGNLANPRAQRPEQGVYPTGYSNMAQRPRQSYRDPVAR